MVKKLLLTEEEYKFLRQIMICHLSDGIEGNGRFYCSNILNKLEELKSWSEE